MKIFGDTNSSEFKNYAKEPSVFFGSNDVLKGSKSTLHVYTYSFRTLTPNYLQTVEPKLYLHISTNAWTTFTGKLREYCLPWSWKTAYLDQEDGTQPRQILVCRSAHDSEFPSHLSKLLGKSLFLTNLINSNHYVEIFGEEFIRLQGEKSLGTAKKITHPLGEMFGVKFWFSDKPLCRIYRPRSLFSRFQYNLLKHFTSSWKEVAIQAGQTSEKILIKKSDENAISRSGLIV